MAKTSFATSGRSTTDSSCAGMANIATPPGKAIVQSGIFAQTLGGQGDPSAMFIIGAEVVAVTPE